MGTVAKHNVTGSQVAPVAKIFPQEAVGAKQGQLAQMVNVGVRQRDPVNGTGGHRGFLVFILVGPCSSRSR